MLYGVCRDESNIVTDIYGMPFVWSWHGSTLTVYDAVGEQSLPMHVLGKLLTAGNLSIKSSCLWKSLPVDISIVLTVALESSITVRLLDGTSLGFTVRSAGKESGKPLRQRRIITNGL